MQKNKLIYLLKNYGVLFFSIVFVLILKVQHLGFPYSWDEAWSYLPALMEMTEKGPGLISGSIGIYSSKGHPLLYYFLTTSWISIFSATTNHIVLVRLFQLFVAITLLICLFFVVKMYSNPMVAGFSVALLSAQTMFLAQSTLILPEVLLALLLLLSFHFFLLKKYGWYAVIASLMVLTKETGLIFVGGFGLFFIVENKFNIFKKDTIWKLLLLSLPFVVFSVHLLFNYRAFQTFFFTEHLDYISFNPEKIGYVLKSATGILFTMHGRNLISAFALLSFLLILFKKEKFENGKTLLLILFQMVLLIAFTSVNFYTYRYMFPAFPLFIILAMILGKQAFNKSKYIFSAFFVLMLVSSIFYSGTKKGRLDTDLGYTIYLPLHKQMVNYCEDKNWYDKTVAAEFNMFLAMRDTFTGYHNYGKGFNAEYISEIENADVVILDSTGDIKQLPEHEKENFTLVKRFEKKNHWGEIYIRK